MNSNCVASSKKLNFINDVSICAIIMFITSFTLFTIMLFSLYHGDILDLSSNNLNLEFEFFFVTPFVYFNYNFLLGVLKTLSFCSIGILLMFSYIINKKVYNILIIPIFLHLLIRFFFLITFQRMHYHFYFDFFRFFESLITFVLELALLITFLFNNKVKKKYASFILRLCITTILIILLIRLLAFFQQIALNRYYGFEYNLFPFQDLYYFAYYIGIGFASVAISKNKKGYVSSVANNTYKEKNIAQCVIFSIFSLGVYYVFWLYDIIKRISFYNKEQLNNIGEIICFIFVPFYSLYWMITRAKKIVKVANHYEISVSDNGTLYFFLTIFGFVIIALSLIQNDLNTIAKELNHTAFQNETTLNNKSEEKNKSLNKSQQTDSKEVITILNDLSTLKENGIISEEEFNKKKKDLLSRL